MFRVIKNTWIGFWDFVRNPKDLQDSTGKIGVKSKRLFSLLALDIPIMILLTAIILGVEQTGLIDTGSHKINEVIQQFPTWLIILFGVFIIPFIEELVFRLYLSLKYNYLAKFIILISTLSGKKNKEAVQTFVEDKWETYFKWIFYASALIFALVHITNFEYSTTLLIFTPLLIAPQFVIGLFAGYLRVKQGFIWGFYLHAIHNLIFLAIPLVFMAGPKEILNISNNNYSIKVEEIGVGKSGSVSSFNVDSISVENVKLKKLIARLMDREEKLIEYSPKEKSNQKINLKFIKYSNNLKSKQIILDELQNTYGFTITKYNILQEAWTIQISDTLLLQQHKNDSSNSSTIFISAKELKMEKVDINVLTKNLNSSYDQVFLSSIEIPDKFNFEFQKKGFSDLEEILKIEYGLILKRAEMEIEHVRIDFKK